MNPDVIININIAGSSKVGDGQVDSFKESASQGPPPEAMTGRTTKLTRVMAGPGPEESARHAKIAENTAPGPDLVRQLPSSAEQFGSAPPPDEVLTATHVGPYGSSAPGSANYKRESPRASNKTGNTSATKAAIEKTTAKKTTRKKSSTGKK